MKIYQYFIKGTVAAVSFVIGGFAVMYLLAGLIILFIKLTSGNGDTTDLGLVFAYPLLAAFLGGGYYISKRILKILKDKTGY